MARLAVQVAPLEGKSAIPVRHGPAAASETWKKGAVLVDSSGRLAEGSANPSPIIGVAVAPITSSSADDDVMYVPAEDNVFEMSIDDSSDLGNGAIAQADLYKEYGITEDSAGVWYVDKNKTGANGRVKIMKFKDASGTTQGRVYVKFTEDQLEVAAT